jgi:hypothetical protein
MHPRETPNTDLRAPSARPGVASMVVMITSLIGLGGCQAIKGIFEVGFGVGVIVVVAVVAIVGGVIAMVSRK